VDIDWGSLNIRDKPDTASYVVTQAPNGAPLTVINQYGNWYVVSYNGIVGWAYADFVTLV
ncbi:MAG: SH3 domain-containing protein, partial [Oscillospiraceae bacterium]|nr:SH3 domain-containing protein [Oscillospiraceae bacterium]